MDKPTEARIKEFWEKLGARHTSNKQCKTCHHPEPEYWIIDGIGHRIYRQELLSMLDLNNLIRYAVTQLGGKTTIEFREGYPCKNALNCCITVSGEGFYEAYAEGENGNYNDKVYALALYSAIEQLSSSKVKSK